LAIAMDSFDFPDAVGPAISMIFLDKIN